MSRQAVFCHFDKKHAQRRASRSTAIPDSIVLAVSVFRISHSPCLPTYLSLVVCLLLSRLHVSASGVGMLFLFAMVLYIWEQYTLMNGNGLRGNSPNEQCYASAMTACARALQPLAAIRLLAAMKQDGVSPNLIALNAAVDACGKVTRPMVSDNDKKSRAKFARYFDLVFECYYRLLQGDLYTV